jgi:hypothetical protein
VIQVSLVPVILGEGIPWLAGTRGPVRLTSPEVIGDRGVTQLRYRVRSWHPEGSAFRALRAARTAAEGG